jgi:hypothetical protein
MGRMRECTLKTTLSLIFAKVAECSNCNVESEGSVVATVEQRLQKCGVHLGNTCYGRTGGA